MDHPEIEHRSPGLSATNFNEWGNSLALNHCFWESVSLETNV